MSIPSTAADLDDLWLRRALHLGRFGAAERNLVTGTVRVTDELLRLFGVSRAALDAPGRTLLTALDDVDRPRVEAALDRLAHRVGEPIALLVTVLGPSGTSRRLAVRGETVADADGRPARTFVTVADVSDLAATAAVQPPPGADGGSAAALLAALPDAVHVYDVRASSWTVVTRGNGFGVEASEVMAGREIERLVPGSDRDDLRRALWAAGGLPDGEVVTVVHRVLRASAEPCWLSRRLVVFGRDEHGRPSALLVVSSEVTDTVAVRQQLEFAATHDDVTELPNRRLLVDELTMRLHDGGVAVLAVDLLGLRAVVDRYGRPARDAVLIAAAQRLRTVVRDGDLVARTDADTFAVVLQTEGRADVGSTRATASRVRRLAGEVAVRIEALLAEPAVVEGERIAVTARIGSCAPPDGMTAEQALAAAENELRRDL